MVFYSICGLGGTGESLYQLHFACKLANRKRTILVSNLALNLEELHKYCGMMKYGWLAHQIEMNRVHQLPGLDNVLKLFEYRRATILLDEAGVYFNTRYYAKMPPEVLAAMAQLRHDGNDLIWAAQYFEQVDKSFRMLCHRSTHAYGISRYSPALKNDELTFRNWATFDPISYKKWLDDKKARSLGLGGFIRTRMVAMKVESGLLRDIDRQAFRCFSSFDRVEDAKAHGNPYSLHLKPHHQVSEPPKIEHPSARFVQHPLSEREIRLVQSWSRIFTKPVGGADGGGDGSGQTRTHAAAGAEVGTGGSYNALLLAERMLKPTIVQAIHADINNKSISDKIAAFNYYQGTLWVNWLTYPSFHEERLVADVCSRHLPSAPIRHSWGDSFPWRELQ